MRSKTKKPIKVGRFEKISREQFFADISQEFPKNEELNEDQIQAIEKAIENTYDEIELPTRSTEGSAGYDFRIPFRVEIDPGQEVKFPTGIKCFIEDGWVLQVFPRSSIGFKYHVVLANTVGIIDSDYYNNVNNEGHIWVKLINHGNQPFVAETGDKICQGIFVPYGITYDDDVAIARTGGIGSTGE